MNRAAAWSVRGVGRETRDIAEEAARRAGMSLGDWLDEVVAEQAAEQGVSADVLDEEDKLDAIGERLSRLSRLDRGKKTSRASAEPEAPSPQPQPSVEEAKRAQERLEAAVAKFETRAAKSEERTAKALESVASWIEHSQADREEERATLQSVAEKLTAFEQRSTREAERASKEPPRVEPPVEEAESEIDKRLSALARRVAAPPRQRSEPRRNSERPRIDVRDSVAQIARRQSELDSRDAVERPTRPAASGWRNFGVDPAPAGSRAAPRNGGPVVQPPTAERETVASGVETLRKEIADLNARMERLRADEAGRPAPSGDADDLRASLAAMSRNLAEAAPRGGSAALERAVGDLGARLDAARRAGASDRLVAPIESMLEKVRESLREHDPRAATGGLEREIRALGGKVDALSRATAGPEVFERLRGETEEVRNLLATAALRPVPIERLERRIAELADRVERIGASPTPHVEMARAVELLADARSQIERSTPAAALNSIEYRLEQLATRMDDALTRTPTIDPRPLEDLGRRIDGVRAFVERRSDHRPDAAQLQATLSDIGSKLDRITAAGVDPKALTAGLQDLTARLEEAFRRSASTTNFDPRPIEDLARRIEAVKATMERQGDFRPHAAKLEAALGDISSKLDRLPAAGVDSKALTSSLQELTARLEEAFRRPPPAAPVDPRPIEDLGRRIEAVKATMERQGDFRPHAAKLETALGEISSKLDRTAANSDSKALTSTLQDLTARLEEAFRRPTPPAQVDSRPLEDLARQIESVRASADFRPHAAKLEAALGNISSKLDRVPAAGADTKALTATLQELTSRLDEVFRRSMSSANFDPRPIEDLVRRIDAARATMERQGDFRPHAAKLETALGEINSKLDRLPASGADATATLTALQAQMGRLEEVLRRPAAPAQIDARPLEELARRIEGVRATADFRPHAAKLEAALGDISVKLDRPRPDGADLKAVTSTLQDLTARVEEVFRRSISSANFDPRPIEDLVRRIETVRLAMDRQTDFRPHAAKLEAALGEINSKLDRAPGSGDDATVVLATLQNQMARLEEAFRRPVAPAQIDTRPLDELARRIEGVRTTVERQADFSPHAAKLEAALGDINAKLDRPPTDRALTSTLQDLTARLDDVFRQPAPAARIDPRPIEDLARRIEGVRVTMEGKEDFRPHAERLEAALSDISVKLDRPPPTDPDSAELTSTLRELTARLDEAFRRPAPEAKIDARPLEDLARRIDGVRASIEQTADYFPEAGKLDAALADIGAKLDRQAFSPDDLRALTSVIQDLASRIDEAGNHAVDTGAIERILRDLAGRPVEVDTAPIEAMLRDLGEKFAASTTPATVDTGTIEAMLRDLGEKFAASATPVAVDTGPIERMLSRVDAKLDAVARVPMDVRPLEQAVRDLHAKLDFRDAPPIDARIIEQAAELLAKRLDHRDDAGIDTEALVGQISEIHGRLDQLSASTQSNAELERTVHELLGELEGMRQKLQSSASAPRETAPLAGDIAELRAEQVHSDRRMQSRLGEVQDILEKLVGRLGRIEDEVARGADDESEPRRPPSTFGRKPALEDAIGDSAFDDAAFRSIPDRVQRSSGGDKIAEANGGESAPAVAPRGAGNFLPQAGEGVKRPRFPEVQSVLPPPPPPPRNSDINAHIAAARRAAQAALLESAAREEEAASSRAPTAKSGLRGSPVKFAREFLAARRRPLLLGVAFLAVVTTLAVVGFRSGGHPPATQKSELPKPLQSESPVASGASENGASSTAASVDYSPVGAVAPARPIPASPAFRPAPADLVAAIPAGFSATLRDAATAGDPAAETEMALRYLEGRSLARDPKIGARWFELAAVQGSPFAQYRIAALYEKGIGVARDVALAKSWYLKAVNAGNARAMHNLAVMFAEDGGAGKPDYAEAAQWFRRAGELGVRDSQFNLAVLLGRGLGVPQDLGQSWVWFSLAARQGDTDAAKKRDEVAAKLDSAAIAAASKALADFKGQTPDPSANEAPVPAGGWDAKTDPPQSSRSPTPAPGGGVSANGSHG